MGLAVFALESSGRVLRTSSRWARVQVLFSIWIPPVTVWSQPLSRIRLNNDLHTWTSTQDKRYGYTKATLTSTWKASTLFYTDGPFLSPHTTASSCRWTSTILSTIAWPTKWSVAAPLPTQACKVHSQIFSSEGVPQPRSETARERNVVFGVVNILVHDGFLISNAVLPEDLTSPDTTPDMGTLLYDYLISSLTSISSPKLAMLPRSSFMT